HRLEVRQQAAEPAVVDVGHPGRIGDLADRVARLLLGSYEEDGAAAVGNGAGELARLVEQPLRLEEVDYVDAVPLTVDETAHLGVPAARLVAEMHAGLQQLLDSWLSHGTAPCSLGEYRDGRCADPRVLARAGRSPRRRAGR